MEAHGGRWLKNQPSFERLLSAAVLLFYLSFWEIVWQEPSNMILNQAKKCSSEFCFGYVTKLRPGAAFQS